MTTVAPAPEDPRLLKLRAGEPLEFPAPPTDREETPEQKEARTIPATWLEDQAPKHARVVAVPIYISHAVIGGPLNLQYATFEAELSITDCRFTHEADFSFATFKRSVTFQGSAFQDAANFRAAHAQGDFIIAGASFADASSFQDLHVDEVLQATGATFGSVNFERIDVSKGAFFRTDDKGQRTTFGGEVRFHSAHIHGNAEFQGSEFKAKARFDGIQVDGSAFFGIDTKDNRTTFDREVRFLGAHIQGNVEFDGAEFKAPANFDGIQVDGHAFFRTDAKDNRTTFAGQSRFDGAHFRGNAEFQGSHFRTQAFFDNFQVDGDAYFRPDSDGHSVQFEGTASFPSAVFGIDAQFTAAKFNGASDSNNAHFRGAADFRRAEFPENKQTSLIGARFERGGSFVSASFKGPTDFTAAIADRDAYFYGATFSKDTSFREARFAVVHFEVPDRKASDPSLPTTFLGGVDLRGFRYDRMGVVWRSLLDKLAPYDRQPYGQLEKTFREAGEDRRGDEVYLQRRRVERKDKWKHRQYGAWFGDTLYRLLANYGVRPYRLLVFTALVLGFGLIVFSYPNAVTQKDAKLRAADPPYLNFWQAAGVSVNLFLPVEIPAGNRWAPTENPVPILEGLRIPFVGRVPVTFTAYASLHRLAGWLLVPLGVAALTGLLHKRGKTDRA